MTTRDKVIDAIAEEMNRIIESQKAGKATERELVDLAVYNTAIQQLTLNS
jgi:hypothetical protein